jgi:hypothetical protein
MYFKSAVVLTGFPVPKPEAAFSVTRAQKLSIWRKLEAASVAGIKVTIKHLFAIEFEVALAIVDYDFIIHGLTSEVLAIGVHRSGGDSVHVRLRDVLGHHWDTELPHIDFLVIRSRHKPSSILNKS